MCPKYAKSFVTFWQNLSNFAIVWPRLDTLWAQFKDSFCLDTIRAYFGHLMVTFLENVSKKCPYTHSQAVPSAGSLTRTG